MVETPQPNPEENQGDPKPEGQNSGEEVVLTAEEYKAKIADLESKSEQEKAGMAEQIKELRKKLHEAQFVKPPETVPEKKPEGGDEVETKIRAVLSKEKEEKVLINRKIAFQKFIEKHPEFNPDNDIAGLRNDVLLASYKRLNTQNSVTEEEILGDLESALLLMNKTIPTKTESGLNQFASTPVSGGKPKTTVGTKLTAEQEKLRQEKGWTEEKYLKMKAKYPKIVI